MDTVSSNIASTQAEVQKSLSELSSKLVERLQLLENIEKAIGLKKEDLRRLYEIEAAERDLDELKAEIDRQRETWEEEQERKGREFEEQLTDRVKRWNRENEEYEYRLAQDRRKKQDEFAMRMEEQEKANHNRQEDLQKAWSNREQELAGREKELADLRQKVAEFPELTKKEVNAAVAIATNSVKKEYETKATLAAKDLETFQKLAEQETRSLREAMEKAHVQISELKTQLDNARADVKEISAKALESASGRDALTQVQRVLEKEQSSKSNK
jgi:hypothetical protein